MVSYDDYCEFLCCFVEFEACLVGPFKIRRTRAFGNDMLVIMMIIMFHCFKVLTELTSVV